MEATMIDFRNRMADIQLGETLLSGNRKHFKEVPLLEARAFRTDESGE